MDNKSLLFSVFICSVTTSLLISAKITEIWGLTLTVGALSYAVLFLVTDVVGEVYGKDEANKLVKLGFLAYIQVIIFSQVALAMPVAGFWQGNHDSYELVLGIVPRVIAGSICSYTVSQMLDVWLFHELKRITSGRYLWLRNNLSTSISQLVDSVIFVTIAFYGAVPESQIFSMVIGQYLFKLVIAMVDTPLVYLSVYFIKKEKA